MRPQLEGWKFHREGDSEEIAASRFLIAIDELRARLDPNDYPNLEISDEGYLWFNVRSTIGPLEVFAMPHGFAARRQPALALSFPHRPSELGPRLLRRWDRHVAGSLLGPGVVPFAAWVEEDESLAAYAGGKRPPLEVLWGEEEIAYHYDEVPFFNYFGFFLPVGEADVTDAEGTVRKILSLLEADDGSARGS